MAFGRLGGIGAGFGHLGASIGGVAAPAGGAALLVGETAGFAADFLHPVDAQRVALKTAGATVSSGTSFFTSSGTSSKWVFNAAGVLVNIPVGTLPLGYDPVTHAAFGLRCEPAATNLLLNNTTLSTQSVTVTATAYTLSFLGTGTVTLTGTSTAGPLVGTGASNRVSLTFTPTAGTLTLTVTGTVSNAQLETGTVATSIIPTAGASVTRASDLYKVTSASINHSATAGSWWADITLDTISLNCRVIGYETSNITPIYMSSGAGNLFTLYDGNSVNKVVSSVLGNHKVAAAFQSADRAITADGLSVATDATAGIALGSPGTSIGFGSLATGLGNITGYIRKVYYLPRRMTNPQLVTATT